VGHLRLSRLFKMFKMFKTYLRPRLLNILNILNNGQNPQDRPPLRLTRTNARPLSNIDGGAPREWAKALARLDPALAPADVPPQRWTQFIDDCGRFLNDCWAERAAALGWGQRRTLALACGGDGSSLVLPKMLILSYRTTKML
jgi:hypothetical protein